MLNLFSDIEVLEIKKTITDSVPNLIYIENYISDEEHNNLIHLIDKKKWSNELKRRVQHYGYKYNYKAKNINESMKVQNLPNWAEKLGRKLVEDGHFNLPPDQLIINEYEPGQGITAHIDCEPCFEDIIVSISLGSYAIMDFTNKLTKEKIPIVLPPKSAVILKDKSRYDWLHGIASRKTDIINGFKKNRNRRISLTYRRVILE